MQIKVCERCGDEVEPDELNNIGLCPDCAEEEEAALLRGEDPEDEEGEGNDDQEDKNETLPDSGEPVEA